MENEMLKIRLNKIKIRTKSIFFRIRGWCPKTVQWIELHSAVLILIQ